MPNQNPPDPNQNQPQEGSSSLPLSPQADLPPLPPEFQSVVETKVANDGSAAPPGPEVTNLVNAPKKKFGTKKIVATILGILLLVGGVGAGIALTSQKQLFQQKAFGTDCVDDKECEVGFVCIEGLCRPASTISPKPSNSPIIIPSVSPTSTPTSTPTPTLTPTPTACQTKTSSQNCDPSIDENCGNNSASSETGGASLSEFSGTEDTSTYSSSSLNDISESDLTGADPNRIYLKITYNNIYCLDGRNCEGLEKKTVVGWKGSSQSDGPKITFGNSQLIPLTNADGKWIKDKYAVFRSSNLVKGLGVTRLGNGNVLISHANNMTDKADYKNEFQAIDATMKIVGNATVDSFSQEDRGVALDQPKECGETVWHGVDNQGNGTFSQPPLFADKACGNDEIIWKKGETSWKHYTRICFPGDDYIIKLTNSSAAPYCAAVKIYNTSWNAVSGTVLKTGRKYRFTALGSPAAGMQKARFKFTLSDGTSVTKYSTQKKPDTNEFYFEYTVPAGTTSLDVKAQVSDGTTWY